MSIGVQNRPSKTASGTALFRAMASYDYPNNKLGPDNLAKYFLPGYSQALIKKEKARTRIKSRFPDGMYEFFLARTIFFDSLFEDALRNDVPQIVILGAGYDTRAYRFAAQNMGTVVFELDIATTQSRKIALLKKAKINHASNIKYVAVDFNEDSLDEVLADCGFDRNKQALFLMEGVTYYLDPESIEKTLAVIKDIASKGSSLAFDYIIRISPEDIPKYYGMQAAGKLMARTNPRERIKFAVEEGKIAFLLGQRGFEVIEHLNSSEIERKYLLDESNTLIGHILGAFCFVVAKSAMEKENP